ncbi:hypothetical protein [Undibacterium sp. CCC3.4]|nr:hypothetical protein [Undibacterium sp. CCC3.4]WPX45638.1 hypothetical protein RHM61_09465 [Undibacterium sp. CCC3.4]
MRAAKHDGIDVQGVSEIAQRLHRVTLEVSRLSPLNQALRPDLPGSRYFSVRALASHYQLEQSAQFNARLADLARHLEIYQELHDQRPQWHADQPSKPALRYDIEVDQACARIAALRWPQLSDERALRAAAASYVCPRPNCLPVLAHSDQDPAHGVIWRAATGESLHCTEPSQFIKTQQQHWLMLRQASPDSQNQPSAWLELYRPARDMPPPGSRSQARFALALTPAQAQRFSGMQFQPLPVEGEAGLLWISQAGTGGYFYLSFQQQLIAIPSRYAQGQFAYLGASTHPGDTAYQHLLRHSESGDVLSVGEGDVGTLMSGDYHIELRGHRRTLRCSKRSAEVTLWSVDARESLHITPGTELFRIPNDLEGKFIFHNAPKLPSDLVDPAPLRLHLERLPDYQFYLGTRGNLQIRKNDRMTLAIPIFPPSGIEINGRRYPSIGSLLQRTKRADRQDHLLLQERWRQAQLIDGLRHAEAAVVYDHISGALLAATRPDQPRLLGHLADLQVKGDARLVFTMGRGTGFDTPFLANVTIYETIAAPGATQRLSRHLIEMAGGGIAGERDFLFDLSHFSLGQHLHLNVHGEQFVTTPEFEWQDSAAARYHWLERQQRARCSFVLPQNSTLRLTRRRGADQHGMELVKAEVVSYAGAQNPTQTNTQTATQTATQTERTRGKRADKPEAACINPASTSRFTRLRQQLSFGNDPLSAYRLPASWSEGDNLQRNVLRLQHEFEQAFDVNIDKYHGDPVLSSWHRQREKLLSDANRYFAASPRLHRPPYPHTPGTMVSLEDLFSGMLHSAPGIVVGVEAYHPASALEFLYHNLPRLQQHGVRRVYIQSLPAEQFHNDLLAYRKNLAAGMPPRMLSALQRKDEDLLRQTAHPEQAFRPYTMTVARATELGMRIHCMDTLVSSVPDRYRPSAFTSGRGQSNMLRHVFATSDASFEETVADLKVSNFLFQTAIHNTLKGHEKFVALTGEAHVNTMTSERSDSSGERVEVPGLSELTGAIALQIQPRNVFHDRVVLVHRNDKVTPASFSSLRSHESAHYLSYDFIPSSPRTIAETALRRSNVAPAYAVLQPDATQGYDLIWNELSNDRSAPPVIRRAPLKIDQFQRWHIDYHPWRSKLGAAQYDSGYVDRLTLEKAVAEKLRMKPVGINFSDVSGGSLSLALARSLNGVGYLRGSELSNINLKGMDLQHADLRAVRWRDVVIDMRTRFQDARFDAYSEIDFVWPIVNEIAALRHINEQQRLLDIHFHHLANPATGSLLRAIDHIAEPKIKVPAMRSLLEHLMRKNLPLGPYLDSFSDVLLKEDDCYMQDPMVLRFIESQLLPQAILQAESTLLESNNRLKLQALALHVRTEMNKENFVFQHSGLINQLIVRGQAASHIGLQDLSRQIARRAWLQLPPETREEISLIMDPGDNPDLAIEQTVRVLSTPSGRLLVSLPAAHADGLLSETVHDDPELWKNFAYFGRSENHEAFQNLSPAEKSLLGTDEAVFHQFPLLGRIYSQTRQQGRRLSFIDLLQLPEQFKTDLIAAMQTPKYTKKYLTQPDMALLSDRFETMILPHADPAKRARRLLTPAFTQQVLENFLMQNSPATEQGALLFGLAAMLTHASSSSIFGVEFESPLPLRGLATAFLNTAAKLNPAVLPDPASSSIATHWEEKLLGIDGYHSYSCTAQISAAMREQLLHLPKNERDIFWRVYPLPWDH